MTDPEFLGFDEAAARLVMSAEEVARLLLAGTLRFVVDKRSPRRDMVLTMDVWVRTEDVAAFAARRRSSESLMAADALVNRAALKFGLHPTRTSPGVRGPGRKNREAAAS